jgi:outer membrane protein TolC
MLTHKQLYLSFIFYIFTQALFAQNIRQLSVQQAVNVAIENNVDVKNAKIDLEIAKAKVGEITGAGLPQVSGEANLVHNVTIQRVILENGAGPFNVEGLPNGALIAFPFQLKNNAFGVISMNQMLFNGSYLIGLKASRTYTQLAERSITQSKITTAENVMKAYYSALVAQERSKIIDVNLSQLDSLLRDTKVMFQNGLVEKIDADRLEVQFNNLKTERFRVSKLISLSHYLLKLQMGIPVTDSVTLTEKLSDFPLQADPVDPATFNVKSRIEFASLQTQRDLAVLDFKNIRSGYLPSLYGFASVGANTAATRFGDIPVQDRWFNYSMIGLKLDVPIFDGFIKSYKMQQSKLSQKKIDNGFVALENAIRTEIIKASSDYAIYQANYQVQARNLDLAKEVQRVAKIKFKQGVGSNLELTSAETALREAEINYYASVYDIIISKIDLEKATGKLYSGN